MVNKITTQTVCYIISLVAVILPPMACAAPEPAIRDIEAARAELQTVEVPVGVTRVVERTVKVAVMGDAGRGGEVTMEAPVTVMVIPTEPPPTPAPGATSTPELTSHPTPSISRWTFFEGPPDLIISGKTHGLRVAGTVISPADYTGLLRNPWLYLRCDAGILETYVTWGGRFIAGNLRTETIATVYKVDDETPVNTTSSESDDAQASFFMYPARLVQDLMETERVVIRVTNYDDTEMTAVFPTAGLSTRLAELSCWR